MTSIYFSKDLNQRHDPGSHLELPNWSDQNRPEAFVVDDDGLVAAVNAALILGQPLLVTGEPGTGKTTLATRLAWQLGLDSPLIFETKSISVARDLFYVYDAVARFQAAQGNVTALRTSDFITFQALGKAILLTRSDNEDLRRRLGDSDEAPQNSTAMSRQDSPLPTVRRSVVVIDEIDKAPRDFPNDLLNEIDRMRFRIPELDNRTIETAPSLRPIVIITSNSEKNLPDPFLRRCVYYHIEFPNETALKRILRGRLGLGDPASASSFPTEETAASQESEAPGSSAQDEILIEGIVRFFLEIRSLPLRKIPATAELIGWARLLLAYGAKLTEPLSQVRDLAFTLPALAKSEEDLVETSRHLLKSTELKRSIPPGFIK